MLNARPLGCGKGGVVRSVQMDREQIDAALYGIPRLARLPVEEQNAAVLHLKRVITCPTLRRSAGGVPTRQIELNRGSSLAEGRIR